MHATMLQVLTLQALLLLVPVTSEQHVRCQTTAGNFTIAMREDWAPIGYKRFMELVEAHFFDGQVIYRTIPGFVYQFGVAADPIVQEKWQESYIPDDEDQRVPFRQGTVSFAGGSGPGTRSCHILIADQPDGITLGKAHHERPIGQIQNPAAFVSSIYTGYGSLDQLQETLAEEGSAAAADYPLLTVIETCDVIDEDVYTRALSSTPDGEGGDRTGRHGEPRGYEGEQEGLGEACDRHEDCSSSEFCHLISPPAQSARQTRCSACAEYHSGADDSVDGDCPEHCAEEGGGTDGEEEDAPHDGL